jgi:hypothetical protein
MTRFIDFQKRPDARCAVLSDIENLGESPIWTHWHWTSVPAGSTPTLLAPRTSTAWPSSWVIRYILHQSSQGLHFLVRNSYTSPSFSSKITYFLPTPLATPAFHRQEQILSTNFNGTHSFLIRLWFPFGRFYALKQIFSLLRGGGGRLVFELTYGLLSIAGQRIVKALMR